MNIAVKMADEGYKTRLFIEPDFYDGHTPIDAISYQTRLRVLDPSVYAVSTAISLQHYAAESLNYHLPVQVHVAEAIEQFLSGRKFRVGPIEQNPLAISAGNRRAKIGSNALDLGGDADIDANTVAFSLGDSHSFTSFASLKTVHIASNISCFFSNDKTGFLISSIAAAVFVAPDYAFGEICLSKENARLLGRSEFERYQQLLASVNLTLSEDK